MFLSGIMYNKVTSAGIFGYNVESESITLIHERVRGQYQFESFVVFILIWKITEAIISINKAYDSNLCISTRKGKLSISSKFS